MTCRLTGFVAGIDEAGRAPLAGPVVSACVVWNGLPPVRAQVNDSKLLTEKKRAEFFTWIHHNAYSVGVGLASVDEIERLNIHQATLLSMERAVDNTTVRNMDPVLVDGLFALKGLPQSKPIVKGDRRCFFIACASIIAKVVRDRLMAVYDEAYPRYNWKVNKGYPTPEHRKAIEAYGICVLHRKTFRGVREHCG
jgi:ribonuclease HII